MKLSFLPPGPVCPGPSRDGARLAPSGASAVPASAPCAPTPGLSIDTVKVVSAVLDGATVKALEGKLDCISRTKAETGEIVWELSTGAVEGSHHSSINVRLMNDPEGKRLAIEGSVHKLALGHNVLGNADGFQGRACELIGFVGGKFQIELPDAGCWSVYRVDASLMFDLGSFEQVQMWFRGMGHCAFPRRKLRRYGEETIYFPGTVSSIKLYHKGPEFKKNSRELRKHVGDSAWRFLQAAADRRLRVEVEIKPRRLEVDGARVRERRKAYVREIDDKWLERIFNEEVDRVFRELKSALPIVRRHEEVWVRLSSTYSPRRATVLFGLWSVLCLEGEEAAKRRCADSTFYRNRKLLVEAGIAWTRTDLEDAEGSPDPLDGLTFRRDDPRRCRETIDEARAQLAAASSAGG